MPTLKCEKVIDTLEKDGKPSCCGKPAARIAWLENSLRRGLRFARSTLRLSKKPRIGLSGPMARRCRRRC